MDEDGHLNVYGGGDYVQMALYTLVDSVCSYLESKVSGAADVAAKPLQADDVLQFKLEQAADLIKKHLLRSVREEMDAIKGKLSALEMKIYRLESENMLLLREYVPAEILEQRRLASENHEEPTVDQRLDIGGSSGSISGSAFDQKRSLGGHRAQDLISSSGASLANKTATLDKPIAAANLASPAAC